MLHVSMQRFCQVLKHNAQSSEKGQLVGDKARAVKQVLDSVPKEAQKLLVEITVQHGWDRSPWTDDCLSSKKWCPGTQLLVLKFHVCEGSNTSCSMAQVQVSWRRQSVEDPGQSIGAKLLALRALCKLIVDYLRPVLLPARYSMLSMRTRRAQLSSGIASSGRAAQKRQLCAALWQMSCCNWSRWPRQVPIHNSWVTMQLPAHLCAGTSVCRVA